MKTQKQIKTVAILGSTGSIGQNALKVISRLKDKFKVVALATGANDSVFARQIKQFKPRIAAIMDQDKFSTLKKQISAPTKLHCGPEGIEQVAAYGADITIMAIGASAALLPTLQALKHTKRLALANKESLVMAGDILMRQAKRNGVEIIPIDSEHSAIFQCLKDEPKQSLEKIYLTGSGGPFKDHTREDLKTVGPALALNHPHWKMGKKITIDSATLMNKGLEVIEAHHLFNLPAERIEVLIHPEAIVHSLVQFIDGSVIAQLGVADMRIPIQYSLTYPQRLSAKIARLDFSQAAKLSFRAPDLAKFPCLQLALQALKSNGLAPAVLNASDEQCVWAYLAGKIRITDIPRIIERVLSRLKNKPRPSLTEIIQTDQWAREQTLSYLN
ncbi:1-deoxy-D-xylulose-5-phosphate reductoisomerase [Candidatus Omnitrophota bacterium]